MAAPITLAILGQRLKEARLNAGVTQEAAADAIGIPRTAIINIESGNRSVDTIELQGLAHLYNIPTASLLDVENTTNDFKVVLHRIASQWKNKNVEEEIWPWIEMCKEGINLEKLLGRAFKPALPNYELPVPRNFADAAIQGEAIAELERKRLGLNDLPIPDMSELISAQSIWATGVKFPNEMSGLFVHDESIGFVILVNYDHPRGRKRFSYAHEYMHALTDRRLAITTTTKENSNDLIERRANAFAGSFLMPKNGVEAFLSNSDKINSSRRRFHVFDAATGKAIEAEKRTIVSTKNIRFDDVALLASHFGVSYQAAVYRLSDLGFIDRSLLKTLLNEASAALEYLKLIGKDQRVEGSHRNDREITSQILPLVLEAYNRKLIKEKEFLRLSEILRIEKPKKLLSLIAA